MDLCRCGEVVEPCFWLRSADPDVVAPRPDLGRRRFDLLSTWTWLFAGPRVAPRELLGLAVRRPDGQSKTWARRSSGPGHPIINWADAVSATVHKSTLG
jgi:hypothetical protein